MSDRKHGCRWKVDGQPTELDRRVLEMARRGCLVPGRELVKTPEQIEGIRRSGAVNTGVLDCVAAMISPGVSTAEIDRAVYDYTTSHGAIPAPLNYEGFPKSVCTSVNDAVLHGVPYDYNLKDGDLVSLDLAINVDGWVADSAISFCVGTQHPDDLRLIKCTEEALAAGIEAAQPGNRLGDVSCAVGDVAREYGYPINLEFGGHGVGHIMHGDPHVPNDGKAHHGYKLRPGLVIAIEPWFLKTTDEIYQDPKDGWTLKSEDGSRGAHSEHTIAITENGPVILTVRD